jgi:hypothetical protein
MGRSIATGPNFFRTIGNSESFSKPSARIASSLDKLFFRDIRHLILKPNTSQKNIFCFRQPKAAGLALCIFPGEPGVAN